MKYHARWLWFLLVLLRWPAAGQAQYVPLYPLAVAEREFEKGSGFRLFMVQRYMNAILYCDYLLAYTDRMVPPLTEDEMYNLACYQRDLLELPSQMALLAAENLDEQCQFLARMHQELGKVTGTGFWADAMFTAAGLSGSAWGGNILGGGVREEFRSNQQMSGESGEGDIENWKVLRYMDTILGIVFAPPLLKLGGTVVGRTTIWTGRAIHRIAGSIPGIPSMGSVVAYYQETRGVNAAFQLQQKLSRWMANRSAGAATRMAWLRSLPRSLATKIAGPKVMAQVDALGARVEAIGATQAGLTAGRVPGVLGRSFKVCPVFLLLTGFFAARGIGTRVDFLINKMGPKGVAQAWIDGNVEQLQGWTRVANHAAEHAEARWLSTKGRIPMACVKAMGLEQYRQQVEAEFGQ